MLHPAHMRITVPTLVPRALLGLALSITALVPGCTSGSGTPGREARETPEFDAIDVSGPLEVTVQVGPERSVEIHGDDNLVPKVRSEVVGTTLHIDLPGRVVTKLPLRALITTPTLVDLEASGAATVTTTGVTGERLEVEASGASRIALTGQIQGLDVDLSGASTLDAASLTATAAKIEASGASKAEVRATDSLHAEASGASSIRYHGAPAQVAKDTSGASRIEPAS
jgi:hypothetical protein